MMTKDKQTEELAVIPSWKGEGEGRENTREREEAEKERKQRERGGPST